MPSYVVLACQNVGDLQSQQRSLFFRTSPDCGNGVVGRLRLRVQRKVGEVGSKSVFFLDAVLVYEGESGCNITESKDIPIKNDHKNGIINEKTGGSLARLSGVYAS